MVVNSRHWMLHNYSSNCWGTGPGFMLFAVEYHLGIRRSWWQWEHSVLFLDIVRLGNLSEQVLHSLNSRETSLEWKFNVLDSTAFCWNNGVAMLMSLLSCWVSLMASNRACLSSGVFSLLCCWASLMASNWACRSEVSLSILCCWARLRASKRASLTSWCSFCLLTCWATCGISASLPSFVSFYRIG